MRYTQRKLEGGVGALRESDDTNLLKPNGQSRNLNVYDWLESCFSMNIQSCPQLLTKRTIPSDSKVFCIGLVANYRIRVWSLGLRFFVGYT